MTTVNPTSKLYRYATILNAFKALYRLSTPQVDNFLKAYEIYDYDWVDGKATKGAKSIDYQEVKANLLNWYGVINHLCAIADVEKMYIPPTMDPKLTVIKNQMAFEKSMGEALDLKPGDQVFELGCGKGRVAAHLASTTGAKVLGINIDQGQLNNAIEFTRKNKLDSLCHFRNTDFNDLPFSLPDNHFDAIYEIQALSLARDLAGLFKELHRVLKPGGKLSLLEWVRLPNYDPKNPKHAELMQKIKPLIGAIGTPSPADYESYLRNAGFEVLQSKDPSINQSQLPLINKAGAIFDWFFPFINFLVKLKILPKHLIVLIKKLGENTDALCEADRLGLVTMSYHLVALKPK